MASTPEGAVKKKVSSYLASLPHCWYNMPVPGGYGKPMLDYVGAYKGMAFAIETKAPGKEPTPRQLETIAAMRHAGVKVFVVDGTPKYPLQPLLDWVAKVDTLVVWKEFVS